MEEDRTEVERLDSLIEELPEKSVYRKRLEALREVLLRRLGDVRGQLEMW